MVAATILIIEDEERDVEVVTGGEVRLSDFWYVNSTSRTFGSALRDDLDTEAGLDGALRAAAFASIADWLGRRARRLAAIESHQGGSFVDEDRTVVDELIAAWVADTDPAVVAEFASVRGA